MPDNNISFNSLGLGGIHMHIKAFNIRLYIYSIMFNEFI